MHTYTYSLSIQGEARLTPRYVHTYVHVHYLDLPSPRCNIHKTHEDRYSGFT